MKMVRYSTDKMNAYPISQRIADVILNEKSLVTPIGKPLLYENDGNEILNLRRHWKKNGSTNKPTLGREVKWDRMKLFLPSVQLFLFLSYSKYFNLQ